MGEKAYESMPVKESISAFGYDLKLDAGGKEKKS